MATSPTPRKKAADVASVVTDGGPEALLEGVGGALLDGGAALAPVTPLPTAGAKVAPAQLPPPPTVADVLRDLAARPPQQTIPTGIGSLDDLIGGWYERSVATVCAPTGAGKTGFVGGLARSLARVRPVLWIATEIDADEQAARLAALATGTPPAEYLAHRADPQHAASLVESEAIYLVELDVYATPDPIATIRAHADAVRRKVGVWPALVVDYLQMLVSDDPERRRLGVSSVIYRLRQLARELGFPAIAISSVSRAYYGPQAAQRKATSDGDEDPRMWLAAAKESGDVEYASAVVAYLDTSPTIDVAGYSPARLIVAKARRGRVGFVGLRFHGPTGRFEEREASVGEMGPSARNASDERKVLAVVRTTAPKALDHLRRSVPGVHGTRVDAAVARLVAAGDLVRRPESYIDGGGRDRKRTVISLPSAGTDPAPEGDNA